MSMTVKFKVNNTNQTKSLNELVSLLRKINNRKGFKVTEPTYLLIDINENRADFCEFDKKGCILFFNDENFKAKSFFTQKGQCVI